MESQVLRSLYPQKRCEKNLCIMGNAGQAPQTEVFPKHYGYSPQGLLHEVVPTDPALGSVPELYEFAVVEIRQVHKESVGWFHGAEELFQTRDQILFHGFLEDGCPGLRLG